MALCMCRMDGVFLSYGGDENSSMSMINEYANWGSHMALCMCLVYLHVYISIYVYIISFFFDILCYTCIIHVCAVVDVFLKLSAVVLHVKYS